MNQEELENRLYAQVVREMEAGIRHDGVWGRAFVEAKGDETTARASYLRMRVEDLSEELNAQIAAEQQAIEQARRREEHQRQQASLAEAERARASQQQKEAEARRITEENTLKAERQTQLENQYRWDSKSELAKFIFFLNYTSFLWYAVVFSVMVTQKLRDWPILLLALLLWRIIAATITYVRHDGNVIGDGKSPFEQGISDNPTTSGLGVLVIIASLINAFISSIR